MRKVKKSWHGKSVVTSEIVLLVTKYFELIFLLKFMEIKLFLMQSLMARCTQSCNKLLPQENFQELGAIGNFDLISALSMALWEWVTNNLVHFRILKKTQFTFFNHYSRCYKEKECTHLIQEKRCFTFFLLDLSICEIKKGKWNKTFSSITD